MLKQYVGICIGRQEDPDQVVMGDGCANTTSNVAYGQVKPGKESFSITLV